MNDSKTLYRKAAIEFAAFGGQLNTDDLEVFEGADVDLCEEGAWVEARIWIGAEQIEQD